MMRGYLRALRFARAWKSSAPPVMEEELAIEGTDGVFPASLFTPEDVRDPLPGWVTLHGITRPGRRHGTLVRFVRALAASGTAVLVPEVQAWRDMRLAPKEAAQILRSAILAMADREGILPGRLGAMGFSFGGPQALMAGADPVLVPHLRVVASFGGYCDIERTIRFLFSGIHEFKGREYRADPDPYGRWVVAGNYLPRARGFEGTEAVAEALLELARSAGDLQIASWEKVHEPRRKELEAALSPEQRELFLTLADSKEAAESKDLADRLIPSMAEAAREDSPLFDIQPHLQEVKVPVRLIHGRQDRLIPFTETLRLLECAPGEADLRVFLTGLFSHSQREGRGFNILEVSEQLRFLQALSVVLGAL